MQVQTAIAAAQSPSVINPADGCQKPAYEVVKQKEVKQLNRVNLRAFIVRQNGKFVERSAPSPDASASSFA